MKMPYMGRMEVTSPPAAAREPFGQVDRVGGLGQHALAGLIPITTTFSKQPFYLINHRYHSQLLKVT